MLEQKTHSCYPEAFAHKLFIRQFPLKLRSCSSSFGYLIFKKIEYISYGILHRFDPAKTFLKRLKPRKKQLLIYFASTHFWQIFCDFLLQVFLLFSSIFCSHVLFFMYSFKFVHIYSSRWPHCTSTNASFVPKCRNVLYLWLRPNYILTQ